MDILNNHVFWNAIGIIALILLFILSVVRQTQETSEHKDAWKNWQDYEPVLGATPWSYLTVPVYKAIRLIGADLLTTHAVFVVGTYHLMDQFFLRLSQVGWFLGAALLALHAASWLNFAFPKYRPQFFEVILGLIKAVGNKISPTPPAA